MRDVKFISFMWEDEMLLSFFPSFGKTSILALQASLVNGDHIQDQNQHTVITITLSIIVKTSSIQISDVILNRSNLHAHTQNPRFCAQYVDQHFYHRT